MIITTNRIPDDANKVGPLTWCVSKKLIPLFELLAWSIFNKIGTVLTRVQVQL